MKRLLTTTSLLLLFLFVAKAQRFLPQSVLSPKIKQVEEFINKDRNEEALTLTNQIIASTNPNDYNTLAEIIYYKGILTESSTATDSVCRAVYTTALDNARKASNITLQLKCLNQIYFISDEQTEKEQIFRFISNVHDTTHNDYYKSLTLLTLSRINKWKGNDGEALHDILEAYTLQKKLRASNIISPADVGNTLVVICRIFGDMQQPEKQLSYIKELRNYTKDNPLLLGNYYFYYGKNRNQALKMEEAILYADSLTSLCTKSHNSEIWNQRLDLYMAISQAYATKNKNGKAAVQYAEEASRIFQKWGYSFYVAQLNYTLGLAFFTDKNYTKAIDYLDQSAKASVAMHYTDMYLRSLKLLSGCYAALGQWQKAYTIDDSLDRSKDSYNDKKTTALFAKAEEEFQNKEKQQKIEVQQQELKYIRKQHIWLIAGLLLATIIVLLLITFYRNKKRTADKLAKLNKELEEANETKARLFGIISHDLRSPVSQVYQYLYTLQGDSSFLSKEQKNNYNLQIQNATESLLETMEDLLVWSKTQMNQFVPNSYPIALDDIVRSILQLLQLNIQTKSILFQNTVPTDTVIHSDPDFLQTILRNLLLNAIKASPKNGTITISFADNQLRIQNTGSHFSQQEYETLLASRDAHQYLSGLGLRLVNELSQKINITVHFENDNLQTTTVVLSFR
ncbi:MULTISPECIES: tetratricopeptide repeat-containing sensor histidine kinase [Chitinophagaceae]